MSKYQDFYRARGAEGAVLREKVALARAVFHAGRRAADSGAGEPLNLGAIGGLCVLEEPLRSMPPEGRRLLLRGILRWHGSRCCKSNITNR